MEFDHSVQAYSTLLGVKHSTLEIDEDCPRMGTASWSSDLPRLSFVIGRA